MTVAPACGGDDDPMGGADASANTPDADPNAPDADPSAPDADPNAPDADPSAPDAGNGGGTDAGEDFTGVECNGMTCTGDDICCVQFGGGGGGGTCTTESACQNTVVACDGPEDCETSEICCGGIDGASCQDENMQCQAEACHIDTDCSDAQQVCCDSFIPGARVCQNQCGGFP